MYKVIQIDFKLFVQENHVSHKTCMCSLGELDEKKNHIKISKAWNFEPNGCNGFLKIIQIS
jgi:hypothetical protein